MKRKDNWPTLLHEFFEQRAAIPFSMKTNNCMLFTIDGVKAITGTDLLEGHHDKVSTVKKIKELLKKYDGVEGLIDALMKANGVQESHPNFAARGDMVLIESDQGPLLGLISTCGRMVTSVGEKGRVFVSRRHAVRAWRVP